MAGTSPAMTHGANMTEKRWIPETLFDGLGFRIIGTIGSPQPSGIPLCAEVEHIGAVAGSELGVAA